MPSMNKQIRKLFKLRRSTSISDDEATMEVKRTVSKKRLRKAVHFVEEPAVVLNDTPYISDEERNAAFWTKDELCDIKKDVKETVCALSRGSCMASARGLEKWLSPLEYRDARQKLLRSVMREQELQRIEAKPADDELLAIASIDYSRAEVEAALMRGSDDHKCVLAMLMEGCSLMEDKIFGQQGCGARRLASAARARRAARNMIVQPIATH